MSHKDRNLLLETETTKKVYQLANSLVSHCKTQNENLSHKTAHIAVQIMLLKSEWKDILNGDITKNQNQSFLKACYTYFFDEKSISSLTVRMQCFFYGRYMARDAYREHQKQVLLKNCFHLLQKLRKVWHNPTENFKDMHKDLIRLILIKEGMDNPEDHSAFDEMTAALNSIFPPTSLSTFVSSNQKTKMAFINEVSSISAGIRLHAWYSDKAGKFMFDVGTIMKETLPRVCEDLHEEYSNIKEKIEELKNELQAISKEDSENKDVYHSKLMLISLTNYFEFITLLKESIDEVAVQTYKLDYSFAVQIKELNSNMKIGPFTKADLVYPYYKNLAKTWKQIQLEGQLLNFYTHLFQDIKKFYKSLTAIEPNDEIPTQEEKDVEEQEDGAVTLILPEDVKNFHEITLQYKEFCAFYFSLGIPIPCKRDLGIVMYKDKCYGFSSKETMDSFRTNPNKYITGAIDYMQKVPQLIFILQMEEYFQFPVINTISKPKQTPPVFIADRSIQTVLHPVEEHIDYTYNWNQWDLRKQALKYVDLLGKKTHSTQTELSHFRRENHSQVYLPKDNSTQTRKDASTSITKALIPELCISYKKASLPSD